MEIRDMVMKGLWVFCHTSAAFDEKVIEKAKAKNEVIQRAFLKAKAWADEKERVHFSIICKKGIFFLNLTPVIYGSQTEIIEKRIDSGTSTILLGKIDAVRMPVPDWVGASGEYDAAPVGALVLREEVDQLRKMFVEELEALAC